MLFVLGKLLVKVVSRLREKQANKDNDIKNNS